MFSRISSALIFAFLAFTVFAATTTTVTVTVTPPAPTATPPPASQCNVDKLQCCNSLQAAGSGGLLSTILGLLGIIVNPVTALVGITCSPISILGIGSGRQCTAQPVCCQNNSFNGLIAIGCTPITIGL